MQRLKIPREQRATVKRLLKDLVAEFDKYFDKVERGETDGMEHTVRRLSTAWADTVVSGVRWVKEIYDATGGEPQQEDPA